MATFKWYLNRQGPQGQRGQEGAKGDPGNTPIFSDGQNTPTVYTMIIDLGDGNTFETKNLKYPMRDDGGDYLRYDISEDTVYLGEPNKADLAGKEGEVRLATTTSVAEETVLDTDAVSYELFEDNNEKVTTVLGNLDDKIEDVDDKVDAEADIRARNDGILDNRISLAEGQITSLNNTKASKQELTDGLAGKANVIHTHTLSQITDAGSLAGQNVVDYQSQVINKPIIPTPGNGTITITQGGVTKGTFTTNQSSNSTIELDAGGGSSSLTGGNGINISNDVVSAKVDNDTINFDSSGNLVANIPDVSNFVTNSSLATTLQSYPTNTQLANTLENYPTKTSQQNIINYELATYDDFTYSDKEFSYAKFPFVGSDECPFYYNEPTGNITATSTGFRFNNNCVKYSLGTYDITPAPIQVRFKAKQGDRINITSAEASPVIRYEWDMYAPDYDGIIDDGHTCISNDYFSATLDYISGDTSGTEYNYQIEVLQDCSIYEIEAIKTRVANPEGTYSFEYIMANNNPAIEFVIPMALDGHIKAIFNPDIAGNGLKINSVNKDRIEADVDGTTIGINSSGKLTYIGTTGDVLPSQTGNSGKFLTTDGSVTSWAAIPQPDLTNYYTKTQTDTLLDGKISTDIVQSPLEYLPDTTSSLTYQNVNTTTMIGSANNGYVYDYQSGNSGVALNILYKSGIGSYDFTSYTTQGCTSYEGLVWFETALTNGINLSLKMGGGFSTYTYCYVLGHYNNTTFVEDAHVFALISGRAPAIYFPAGGIYGLGDGIDNGTCLNITQSGTTLKWYKVDGNANYNQTKTLSQTDADTLALATHIRVIKLNSQSSYQDSRDLALSEIRVINPATTTEVATLSYSDAVSLFDTGTNIFDAHPASLSLKYDSNTLGVNASNELYAISSTPSNMVTTNTVQDLSNSKYFTNDNRIHLGISNSSSPPYGNYNQISRYGFNAEYFVSNSNYGSINFSTYYGRPGFTVLKNGNPATTIEDNYGNYWFNTGALDGTTIMYNSSTGKISAAGGSTPIKKTITQASANVSESSGTVTVTDADVTTSTMVSLYPSDTATETWLANNLASNIITEGSGSFTFTINGTLPSTFSMYYIIQEVD